MRYVKFYACFMIVFSYIFLIMNDESKAQIAEELAPFRRHLFYPHFLKDRLQEPQDVISKFVE